MLKTFRNIILLGLLLLTAANAFAGIDPYKQFIKGSLKAGDSLILKDEKFRNVLFNWSNITNITVDNHLQLSILDESAISQSFSCRMNVRVEYFSDPAQVSPTKIDSVIFNVNYDKQAGAVYKGIADYTFTNGYYVKVYIHSVNSPEYGTNLPPVLQLTSSIVINRTYLFTNAAFLGLDGTPVLKNGKKVELPVVWDPVLGAEEYDLEWVAVDNDAEFADLAASPGSHSDAERNKFFKYNATRVTVAKEFYNISLMFNAKYLMVRIRQVRYLPNGLRDETAPWWYKKKNNIDYAIWELDWHEPALNWQYSASYAEEGKKKEVVSYFDGTLRSRQTVTMNNEQNVAIVQENVYDQFGRSAASILPAPVKEATGTPYIHYFPAFNRNDSNVPYSYADLNADNCEPLPGKLDSLTTGASRYYSFNNEFKNDKKFNKYIPKALGYPLSVTQYTADNTGKIKLQGGVGPVFQPGQQLKATTQYYYGKPNQQELDRLFGNDVGYANHYLKNMVVDPNGQISISYTNLAGKTIATALSGNKPDNLDTLKGNPVANRAVTSLLDPSQFSFSASSLKLSATTTYTVSVTGADTIKYNIQKLINNYPGGSWQTCSNCFYNLQITIRDNCNNPVYTTTSPVQIGSATANPLDTAAFNSEIHPDFNKIGEYYITFEFALSKEVIANYTKSWVTEGQGNGNLKRNADFVLTYLQSSRFEDCFADCSNALKNLGSRTAFTAMFKNQLSKLGDPSSHYNSYIDGLYTSLHATATALAGSCVTSPCDDYRTVMLQDVSPGGQYALVDTLGNLTETSINVLSLYFKNGAFNNLQPGDTVYQQNLITLENGQVTSPYDQSFNDVRDLIRYWQPEWAKEFLQFHPEYCKLQFCMTNSNSKSWDEGLTQKNLASQVGYSRSNSTNWLLDNDPFFMTGAAGAARQPDFALDLASYSSRVLHQGSNVKSLFEFVDYMVYCADSTATTNTSANPDRWTYCAPDNNCRSADREWESYRTFYLDRKAYYFDLVRKSSTCWNACEVSTTPAIGNTNPGVTCTTMTLTYGTKISDDVFSDIDYNTNQQYTYTFVSGNVNNEPPGTYNCNGLLTKEFYPCVDVAVGANSYRFNNVWRVTCSSAYSNSCTGYSGALSADAYPSLNRYAVFSGGTTYYYTVYEGYTSSFPPAFDCDLDNSYPIFFDCYEVNYGGLTTYYTSVWVNVCYTFGSNYRRAGNTCSEAMPAYFEKALNANVNLENSSACEEMQQLRETNTNNTLFVSDYRTNAIFSISKTAISQSDTASVESQGRKRFGNYVFKENLTIEDIKGSRRFFKNVWVAEYIPEEGSARGKMLAWSQQAAAKKVAVKNSMNGSANRSMQVNTMETPATSCFDGTPGFYIGGGITACYDANSGQWGKEYTISVDPSVVSTSCELINFYVEVRLMDYMYNSISVDFVQLDPIAHTATICIPDYFVYEQSGQFFVCSENTNPCPPANPCNALYAGKVSRFEKTLNPDEPINSGQYIANQGTAFAMQVQSACAANAEVWMEKLAAGLNNYSPTLQAQLKNNLIELCAKGGDQGHPFGSSSLPAGQSVVVNGYNCTTFAEVIKRTLSLTGFTNELNPWLLDGPYPYATQPVVPVQEISKTDAALCARLTALNVGAWTSAAPFHAYLSSTYGSAMTLTVGELDTLMKGCSCKYVLAKDLRLPVFMSPGFPSCITAGDYATALNSLNTDFGIVVNAGMSNYQTILANYMNHRFGFAYTYDRYADFALNGGELCYQPPVAEAIADPYACAKDLITKAYEAGNSAYEVYIAEEKSKFEAAYINTCAAVKAYAKLHSEQYNYHYTLYYYDLAGNLVRTVPPEGVTFLTANELQLVQKNREVNFNNCNYNGPTTAAVENTALQDLSNTLAASGNHAVELWLYSGANGSRQFITYTPDMKYMVQACLNGNLVNVDVFSLNQTASTNVSITLSNHVTANVSDSFPLAPWTHLVIQGNSLASGALQLWVNGKAYIPVAGAPSAGCGWAITSNPVTLPKDLSILKHLKLYSRLMTPAEILANAGSPCFRSVDESMAWYRFNLPAEGEGPTTIAATGTNETQYKGIFPAHKLTTTYAYNATNQVVQQYTPDAETTKFWYDRLSRLLFSQNARQAAESVKGYSYTKYDALGRITEVGQKNTGYSLGDPRYLTAAEANDFMIASGNYKELTQTVYDQALSAGNGVPNYLVQQNLRKRVAASIYRESPSDQNINASYYSYDLSGNVKTLYQQVNGLDSAKRIDYEYDLVSGKVNFLAYQKSANDQFYYQYKYDAENRLIGAFSGIKAYMDNRGFGSILNPNYARMDASYEYYLHGPLARTELGREKSKVQGLDYAYTLQGWLKMVNGTQLNDPSKDIGTDGAAVGKDALAYSLGYYNNDYQAIDGTVTLANKYNDVNGRSLYNGNISNSTYAIAKIDNGNTFGYSYNYDQLNRLLNLWQHSNLGSSWDVSSRDANKFAEQFTYDGNGNILKLIRNKASGTVMDELSYVYDPVKRNRLLAVNDAKGVNNGTDIGNSAYTYDAIGNLTGDTGAQISNIDWNVYGKIKQISKAGGNISYGYDPAGNRVSKSAGGLTTYYIRDAQGNSLAVYDNAGNGKNWREMQLYGSSRLGMWRPDVNLATAAGASKWNNNGLKFFELSNHLGNVMAVINDNRNLVSGGYEPVVINANDYYAFGSQMIGRTFTETNALAYRYGFNGKENDNEVKGDGNQQDYGMRIYDPRIGRFLSVDPITAKYPELTPYQFASNSPIYAIDLDGLEACGNPWAHSRGLTGHNCVISLHKDATIKQTVGQVGAMGLLYTTAIFGPEMLPLAHRAALWGSSNPESLMTMTGVGWGLLTNEDMPGAGDDFGRGVKGGGKWILTEFKDLAKTGNRPWYKYQKQINEMSGSAEYLKDGVKFDGYKNGVFKEAKSLFQWLFKTGRATEAEIYGSMAEQLVRQIKAANGAKLEWHFAEKATQKGFKDFLKESAQGKELLKKVELIFTPAKKK